MIKWLGCIAVRSRAKEPKIILGHNCIYVDGKKTLLAGYPVIWPVRVIRLPEGGFNIVMSNGDVLFTSDGDVFEERASM